MLRLLVLLAAVIAVPTAPPVGKATMHFGVWTIHLTVVNYNMKTGDFSTPNHVTMTRTGVDVAADHAKGNEKRKEALLTGHVVMHDSSGPHGPSTLLADIVSIQAGGALYVATGNVHFEQGATIADANAGTLNQLTHTMTLTGNVRMHQGARTLLADSVIYDTITGVGQAHNGTLAMPGSSIPRHR